MLQAWYERLDADELTALKGSDPDERAAWVRELLDAYAAGLHADREHLFRSYRFVDMARKVVGVGSVGTRAWIFLLVSHGAGDPLVLQAKEAVASVLEPHLGASEFASHGERMNENGLATYTRACAWSLARSHARSGNRLAIAAYLGKGEKFDAAGELEATVGV